LNDGMKEGYPHSPTLSPYFIASGPSSVKTVADKHRHAAYYNKH